MRTNEKKFDELGDYLRGTKGRPIWMASDSEINRRVNSLPPGFDRYPGLTNFSAIDGFEVAAGVAGVVVAIGGAILAGLRLFGGSD